MALNTLKGVKNIGGYDVVVMDELREKYPEKFNESGAMDYKWFEKEIRPKHFVYVRHDVNSISFTIQNGPVKEKGLNGCQVDTLLHAAGLMLVGLQKEVPCDENYHAWLFINQAISLLNQRKENREKRGVEGTSLK